MSTLIQKTPAAYKPFSVRQAELAVEEKEKRDYLHHPDLGPPSGNKGYRDVRLSSSSYQTFCRSSSLVELGLRPPKNGILVGTDSSSIASKSHMSKSMSDDGTEITEIFDQGRTSLVFLQTNNKKTEEKKMRLLESITSPIKRINRVDRPYTSGVSKSMRLSQTKVTSGPFPEFRTEDEKAKLRFALYISIMTATIINTE